MRTFVFESLQWTCCFQTGTLFPGVARTQADFHGERGLNGIIHSRFNPAALYSSTTLHGLVSSPMPSTETVTLSPSLR
jgi:hypothetical protein